MRPTVIFIHGMFQNAASWAAWAPYFEQQGFDCITESWPLHKGDPAALRARPPADLGKLELQDVIDRYAGIARGAVMQDGAKPLLVGHSVGGLVVQKLVAMGLADGGVCISSVAPNRMISFDLGMLKNALVIANPLKGDRIVQMDAEDFHHMFANTLRSDDSNAGFERTATHDSRNVFRDCLCGPGDIEDMDALRAPLLLLSAQDDKLIPPELCEKNARAYGDNAVTHRMFPDRSHFICGEPGWQEVAAVTADFLQRAQAQSHVYSTAGAA
jgi:alpha-beta hydrolase superfamily lysophospholipase